MALFRCKMCGGALEVQGLSEVVQCSYCGTKQTIPRLSDDKRSALYDRAGSFRRNSEFDKASALYEEILGEDPTDAEAYWSLVLCHYGIVYVSDPATNRKIPTVNRVQYTSVFDDENYKFALKYATPGQQEVYRSEAEAINEIQKRYLAISQKEEPFDVFICYKETDEAGRRTPDSVLAQELYYELTEAGFKVFFARITLESKLGCDYEPYIFSALHSSKLMVVLGTKPEYFNAVWVKNEWSRFIGMIGAGERKVLIPAYRDMDPYLLPPEFSHLQALDMAKLGFMQDLIHGIRKILGESPAKSSGSVGSSDAGEIGSYLKRIRIFLDEGSFNQAAAYCEKVLDRDPENGEAYFLKLQAQLRVSRETALADYNQPLDTLGAYRTALRFADPATKDKLERYNATTRSRFDGQIQAQNQARLAEEQRKQAEALAHQQYQYQRQAQIRNEVIELEAKRKRQLTWGIILLFFFWPVGAYLLYASNQTKNELRIMGYDPKKVKNTVYKKKSTFTLIIGVILIFFGLIGTFQEIEAIANGEPDPAGVCVGLMFIVIGLIVCKRKKEKQAPPPPTTVNLNEQFGQFFDPMQNQYKNK